MHVFYFHDDTYELCARAGGMAVIDSFCWLHDIGRGLGRMLHRTPTIGRKLVTDRFITLIEFVRSCGGAYSWLVHAVFDGASAPAKANEDSVRQRKRMDSLEQAKALEKQGLGTTAEAKKLYDNWWRPSHQLVHEIFITQQ